MVKYNRKWCLKHCPYIKENKKLRFQSYKTLYNLCFYPITDKINNPCIKIPDGFYIFETNSKKIEKYIKENVDMEKYAKSCPVYSEMMMENW